MSLLEILNGLKGTFRESHVFCEFLPDTYVIRERSG